MITKEKKEKQHAKLITGEKKIPQASIRKTSDGSKL